ncbi:unnamed protein product [Cyclocybe aegerita]|uniref:Pentatricopeptide repeat-containing protein n=1 Tax=Cyclocybe aegerita TaxID=1973307 RepID=A0A8S0W7E2_CYCAE|nr:unnamed protein product [Cyclocybe aegerita]
MEPLASGVINTLLPRHVLLKQASSSVARAAKASTRHTLASNFFTPRQDKGKAKAVEEPPLGDGLDVQAWACSSSRQPMWNQDRLSRSVLLGELESSEPAGRSSRTSTRTSTTSRSRFHQPSSNPRSVEPSGSHRQHLSYSTSSSAQPVPEPDLQHDSDAIPDKPVIYSAYVPTSYKRPEQQERLLDPLGKLVRQLKIDTESFANLQALEGTYILARDAGCFDEMPPTTGYRMLRALGRKIDSLCVAQAKPEVIQRLGGYMFELYEKLPPQTKESIQDLKQYNEIMGQALAFMGRFKEARSLLDRMYQEQPGQYRIALAAFLSSMARQKGIYNALEYWINLNATEDMKSPVESNFRKTVAETVEIASIFPKIAQWSRDQQEIVLNFVLGCAVDHYSGGTRALDVIKQMRCLHMKIQSDDLLEICSKLATAGDVRTAQNIFTTIEPEQGNMYSRVRLLLASRAGDVRTLERVLEQRENLGINRLSDNTNALYGLAVAGETRKFRALFEHVFSRRADGQRVKNPNIVHYSMAILAHSVKGVVDGLDFWLEDMQREGVRPNVKFFSSLIQVYRKRGDDRAVLAVVKTMRNAGIQPDRNIYTSLISHMANRKNAKAADTLYVEALEEGIQPDVYMTKCLLNAHVQAGSYAEVARIFHHLTSLPSHRQPDVLIYNLVLKSYILIGAPLNLVLKLFFKIIAAGAKPDSYTYTLLIMSACESQQLGVANSIYHRARTEEKETGKKLLTVHSLTIMMATALHLHNENEAKFLLDYMMTKGSMPNSVTYREIVRSYGFRGEEGLRLAEEFVRKMANQPFQEQTWATPVAAKRLPLTNLYEPLLRQHAKRGNVEEVERLYTEYVETGGEPSVGIYHYLLDAYRTSGNVRRAMEVWDMIMKTASRPSFAKPKEGEEPAEELSPINGALTVYLDILSKAALHEKMRDTWLELQNQGMKFDHFNWNALVTALIRAGQMERAFEVLEKVLLPSELKTRINHGILPFRVIPWDENAPEELKVPVKHEHKETYLEKYEDIPPPMPRHNKRQRALALRDGHTTLARREELRDRRGMFADLTYPLRVLQKVPPNYNIWRPHKHNLRSLMFMWIQLRHGYLPRETKPDEQTYLDVAIRSNDDYDVEEAETLLETLRENYPNTVQRIERFMGDEKGKMTETAFQRRYTRR